MFRWNKFHLGNKSWPTLLIELRHEGLLRSLPSTGVIFFVRHGDSSRNHVGDGERSSKEKESMASIDKTALNLRAIVRHSILRTTSSLSRTHFCIDSLRLLFQLLESLFHHDKKMPSVSVQSSHSVFLRILSSTLLLFRCHDRKCIVWCLTTQKLPLSAERLLVSTLLCFVRGRQRMAASIYFVPYSAVGAKLGGFVSCH